MTWTRFEAKARAHAKCVKAGNDAASFWAWAVMWSNDNGTDGYLDGSLLGAIMPNPIANDLAKALADRCVGASIKPGGSGLFELAPNGYMIHDFHQFQPPADEDQKASWLSHVRSLAGKRGAERRWQGASKLNGKTDSIPSRARASDRIGPDRSGDPDPEGSREGRATPEAERAAAEPAPVHESALDFALRIFEPAWEIKYKRRFVLAPNTGVNGESSMLAKAGIYARDVGKDHAEAYFRHFVRAFLRDHDKFLEQTSHSPIGLTAVRLRGYGEPKKPRPAPLEPAPQVEPSRPFVKLEPIVGPAPIRKTASTPDDLETKKNFDLDRLAASFGAGGQKP